MAEVKKKGGVEIHKEGQRTKIYVPSYNTMIIVFQEDKKQFVEYLKYIYNKFKVEEIFYINHKKNKKDKR